MPSSKGIADSPGWWYLPLLAGVLLISTSAIMITLAGAPPTVSAFYRNFLAAAIWAVILPFTRSRSRLFSSLRTGRANRSDETVFGFRLPSIPVLFLLLGIFFAADLWAWHRAIIRLGAGPATLMGNLQVLFVSFLGARLFGERLGRWYWTGCVLALAGIGLLNLARGWEREILAGISYGLVTAVTYAVFLIVLKFINRRGIDASITLFFTAASTAAVLAPAVIAEGESFLLASRTVFLLLLLHGFVSSVIGWWLIVTALKRLPVSITSVILLLQPVLTSIWGAAFLGQRLGRVQVAGIGIALFGIWLASRPGPGSESVAVQPKAGS